MKKFPKILYIVSADDSGCAPFALHAQSYAGFVEAGGAGSKEEFAAKR